MDFIGLCYRCEFRAQFHETGRAPRVQCGETTAVQSCYQYQPVKPVILAKNEDDPRPQFAGAMLSSRSHAVGIPDLILDLAPQDKNSTAPYWVPKSLDELHVKSRDVLDFLDNHPAIGAPVFNTFNMLEFDIAQVCQNRQLKPHRGLVSVRYSPVNYERFKKEFDAEFKEYSAEELKTHKNFISIDVPYKTLYGSEWAPHHIEYWGELDFAVYLGKTFENSFSRSNWDRLSGISAVGLNFQEMIINLGNAFKKTFGNYDNHKLLTTREKLNHKKHSPFLDVKETDVTGHFVKMQSNPKWIHVSPAEINRRWVKRFAMTSYARKHWLKELLRVLHGEKTLYQGSL